MMGAVRGCGRARTWPAGRRHPGSRQLPPPRGGLGRGESVGEVPGAHRASRSTGTRAMLRMNHEDGGFDCPGCAWPDDHEGPAPRHLRERHQARHLGDDRASASTGTSSPRTPSPSCPSWSDFALEDQGRLTEPMVYDAGQRPLRADQLGRTRSSWSAPTLRGLDSPDEAAFYTSGRLEQRGHASSTSCGRASSAPTTCPTARTCATRPAAGRCRPRSAPARAPSTSRTGTRPTRSS